MTTYYIVYRNGSNAANQSMTQRMALGTLVWPGRLRSTQATEALNSWAQERGETVYNNQWLTYQPYSRASVADRNAANEAEAEQC